MATWNVQGIQTKLQEVIKEIQNMDLDIVALSETKKKGVGIENIQDYIHIYSGVAKEERAKRGVALLIKRKYKNYITNFDAIDERIVKVHINLFGRRLAILGIYGPNDGDTDAEKDLFYNKLQEVVDEIGNNRKIIIMGDFNGRTGSRIGDPIVGRYGEAVLNNNGERLIEFCQNNDLKIANGFFEHKDIHKFTWIQATRRLQSIIDYIVTPQNSDFKFTEVRAQRGAESGSDHHLLLGKVVFPYQRKTNKNNNRIEDQDDLTNIETPTYNVDSFINDSTKQLYQTRLDQYLEEKEYATIEEMHEHIKRAIHQAAMEALGVVRDLGGSKKKWYNAEIDIKVNEKKEAYRKWLNTKRDDDLELYKEKRRAVKQAIIREKRNSWDQKCREIETYIGGRKCTEAWKFINNIRSDNIAKFQSIPMRQWEDHYKELLTETRADFAEEHNPIEIVGEQIEIELEETAKAIKKLKNGKASGPGGIKAEMIKNGTEKLKVMLTSLINRCLKEGQTPKEWKTGYMTSIHKKGNKQECNNYRGITVTPTLSRIYGRILKDIIEKEYQGSESEEQSGFRAGRSCVDNIFCLKQIIEKRISVNREVHMLFIDLSKAYDNVPNVKLWEALRETNIHEAVIKSVQELYNGSYIQIKMGSKISKGFPVSKGLRQGCCMSPTLFKIYVDKILYNWKRKCRGMGFHLNNTDLFTLQFADDQVIIAQDKDDLEYMTRKIKEEFEKGGLHINIDKTKYLCIGNPAETNLKLNGGLEIEICKKYKYLGVEITNDGKDNEEIKQRVGQGRKAVKRLNGIWWHEGLTRGRKKRIYNTIVKTILTYGSETWNLSEADKKRINTVEMDALRRSCRVSRREHITNESIRQRMEVKQTIIEEIEKKQLIWFGHVRRMPEERLPRVAMEWMPPERKKRGRPRRSWGEGIKKAMSERNLSEENCYDRKLWRTVLEIGRRRQTL